jgi:DNA-binding MarR family transcriptional regulator
MTLEVHRRLGYDIKAAEVAFMSAKADALRALGLSVAQYAALLTLRDNPGISGAGLARACLVTPQASAATLKTLEAKGLVTREQDDWNRNARPTRLTDDGARLVAEADAVAVAVEQRMHDALDGDERATLRRLLAKCREAAGA